MERLSETEACGFDDLFDGAHSRGDLITTFLALLEMIRLKLIRVFQSGTLGPIRVYLCGRPQGTPPTKEAGDRSQETGESRKNASKPD